MSSFMLDDEQTVKWLIVVAIIATVVLYRYAGKRSDRKRREWFESVAAALGARAEHESEFLSRFAVEVDQRRCEVTYRYGSGGLAGRGIGWSLIAGIPLEGVSDIYSLVLQPSDDPGDNGVRVRNSGFKPREGWLNADVRAALSHFYELAPRHAALDVAAGSLMCRDADRVEGPVFRARIARLVPVAKALERTL